MFACRLHPKNCLGVRQFAETMMCTTLYDSANSFLHQHFVEVSLSEEFLGLRTEELLELVGCDELNVKAEEQVSRLTLGRWREASENSCDFIIVTHTRSQHSCAGRAHRGRR